MVVIAHHYLIALVQPAHYFQRFRSSSICLHFFLEIVYKENVEGLLLVLKEKSPDQSALETIAVLAFVSLVLGLFFKLHILHYIALFLLFIGIFLRGLSVRIANIWLKFSAVLGGISTRIVLLVISPLNVTVRLGQHTGMKGAMSTVQKILKTPGKAL